MADSLTITRARLLQGDRCPIGDLVIEDGVITFVGPRAPHTGGEVLDADGLLAMPGLIDTAVWSRSTARAEDPEDIASVSRAAANGGVTAFLGVPDRTTPTASIAALQRKLDVAARASVVNYAFFVGRTAIESEAIEHAARTPGLVLWVGETEEIDALEPELSKQKHLVCFRWRRREHGVGLTLHGSVLGPADAAALTRRAIQLSSKHGIRVHIASVSTVQELEELATADPERVSAGVDLAHLLLDEEAYATLGSRAVCDPPIRDAEHVAALWQGVREGLVRCIASGHRPHIASRKDLPYPSTPGGVPAIEVLLPALIDAADRALLSLEDVARATSTGPAELFGIPSKGRLEVGYDADVVLVDTEAARVVDPERCLSKAGWSPWTGRSFTGWPIATFVAGRGALRDGRVVDEATGRELVFDYR